MGTKWRGPEPTGIVWDSGFWNGVVRDVFLYALAISAVVGLAVWLS